MPDYYNLPIWRTEPGLWSGPSEVSECRWEMDSILCVQCGWNGVIILRGKVIKNSTKLYFINMCLWLNADTHHHIITFFFLSDMTTTIRDPQEGTQTCWLVSFQTRQMVPQGLISCATPTLPHICLYVLELGHIFHWWTTTQLNLFNMWGTTSISQQYQTEERFKTLKKITLEVG